MPESISVFILAAGLGERLRPVTSYIPKPLLPIAGKPVIQRVIEKLSILPAGQIGINLHYKQEAIEHWISRSAYNECVVTFPESRILGTGGGLKNAEGFLSGKRFLVHNSDILSDIDLGMLINAHCTSGNLATLAVHDFPRFNRILVDNDGVLKGHMDSSTPSSEDVRLKAFTGIAVYNPEFLYFLPQGHSSVVDAWILALSSGERIGTVNVTGCYWSDIGTPADYAAAVVHEMREEGETVYIHPSAEDCSSVGMDGYVIIEEKCRVGKGSTMRNCILLPGSRVEQNSSHCNCIIGPDFEIPLEETAMPGFSDSDGAIRIGQGGSDREYRRVREGSRTKVIVSFSGQDQDFLRQIEYTRFLLYHGIPVPKLIATDFEGMTAAFEDLGDLSLYSWLRCRRPEKEVESMYQKVIDIAVMIHTGLCDHLADCPLLRERVFDYAYFRWETEYCIEEFIRGVRNMNDAVTWELDRELCQIAEEADAFHKTIIHRDFQSQNVMVAKGETPRIIDYQGMRIGPPAYDVASLLWDPYYRLESELRERLLFYYLDEVSRKRMPGLSRDDFMSSLIICRIQRHMQALGAYGFLSHKKGKRYFLKFAGEGVRLLKEDMNGLQGRYPHLFTLVMSL
jgi:NDP-sugar pyrophosphorylase family protein/aminoglycoside/choline kinase family phosphotransferase